MKRGFGGVIWFVNPARAGMILVGHEITNGMAGKPRASGDDPFPERWTRPRVM